MTTVTVQDNHGDVRVAASAAWLWRRTIVTPAVTVITVQVTSPRQRSSAGHDPESARDRHESESPPSRDS